MPRKNSNTRERPMPPVEPVEPATHALTADELEQMALSLIERGLRDRGILDRLHAKPEFNRGSRPNPGITNERQRK